MSAPSLEQLLYRVAQAYTALLIAQDEQADLRCPHRVSRRRNEFGEAFNALEVAVNQQKEAIQALIKAGNNLDASVYNQAFQTENETAQELKLEMCKQWKQAAAKFAVTETLSKYEIR